MTGWWTWAWRTGSSGIGVDRLRALQRYPELSHFCLTKLSHSCARFGARQARFWLNHAPPSGGERREPSRRPAALRGLDSPLYSSGLGTELKKMVSGSVFASRSGSILASAEAVRPSLHAQTTSLRVETPSPRVETPSLRVETLSTGRDPLSTCRYPPLHISRPGRIFRMLCATLRGAPTCVGRTSIDAN